MPSTSTATAEPVTTEPGHAQAQPVHPRPEHHGLVVTGAQRWPWYEERAERAPEPSA